MSWLKNLRLSFTGELHEIHLVNFTVDPAELRGLIPAPIRLRLFGGRAMISMVDVRLRDMKAKSKWLPFSFEYQHIGFRVLVEDGDWNDGQGQKGIFFLRSFTDNAKMVWAGNLVSNYNLELASLRNFPTGLRLEANDQYLEYLLAGAVFEPNAANKALKTTIGAIDRAWAVEGNTLQKTQIMREKWPLQAMNCVRFSTNFFETARLEGVFRVPETIYYTWLAPEIMQQLPLAAAVPSSTLSYA